MKNPIFFCSFALCSIYTTPYPFHSVLLIITIIMSICIITMCDKNIWYILFILTIVKKITCTWWKKTIEAYVCIYICIDDASCTRGKLNRKIWEKNNSLEWDEKNVCRVRRVIYRRRRRRHTYRRRGRIHGRFFISRPHQRCDITGYLLFFFIFFQFLPLPLSFADLAWRKEEHARAVSG